MDKKPVTDRKPSSSWWAAAIGLLVVGLPVWGWASWDQAIRDALGASFKIIALNVLIAVGLATVVTGLLHVTLGRFAAFSRWYTWALITVIGLLTLAIGVGPSLKGWVVTVVLLMILSSVAGGTAWMVVRHTRRYRYTVSALAVSIALLACGAYWFASSGPTAPKIIDAASQAKPVAPLALADPSQPGTYQVGTLTYGSGKDLRQPEYGKNVTIKTDSVDASKIIKGWTGAGSDRSKLWGFDAKSLPVNARVWYPKGDGQFPLVLMLHGNTSAHEFSDSGYNYLGELLASRGFITASVDENFLNTGILDKSGGLTGVSAARGWLLLEHLQDWQAWNKEPGSPFYGKIDMNNIALVGHSRGGEAVATAAAFNKLSALPDNPDMKFNYGFNVRSVVALAPSDGQYIPPSGKKISLTDINYLTLEGSHDADVTSFGGLNQYQRVNYTDTTPAANNDPSNPAVSSYIKAALYIYRADHDQFNTQWGRYDVGQGLAKHFISTAALLSPSDQQQIAKVYVSAFLEATMHKQSSYAPLFSDARVGRNWLPNTTYLNDYATSDTKYADVNGTASGFTTHAVQALPLRGGPGDSRVMHLVWSNNTNAAADKPRYTLPVPATNTANNQNASIRFDLADARSLADYNMPLTLSVEVKDDHGATAKVPLSQVMQLQPPVPGQYLKAAWLHSAALSEPVPQSFIFPVSSFKQANKSLDISKLVSVSLVFDGSTDGAVYVGNVGVTQ